MRACVRLLLNKVSTGYDLIFLARRPIELADYQELCNAIVSLLKRAGLLEEVG
jgi:RNase P protein component